MAAPQSLEKTVSVKVGIVGDSVKSSDKLDTLWHSSLH